MTWKYVLFTLFKQSFSLPILPPCLRPSLPYSGNRRRFLVTDGVKTHLPYVTRCSYLCFLSNMQVLGSKFVLVSFLRHCPPALAPVMVRLLFSLFLPFCLTTSWLSGFTGLNLSVGNTIKSFLYLDANIVMTSCGHVFQVPPG